MVNIFWIIPLEYNIIIPIRQHSIFKRNIRTYNQKNHKSSPMSRYFDHFFIKKLFSPFEYGVKKSRDSFITVKTFYLSNITLTHHSLLRFLENCIKCLLTKHFYSTKELFWIYYYLWNYKCNFWYEMWYIKQNKKKHWFNINIIWIK